ncbi:hypothetical protein CRG98_004380 [Punica granatum]|uniref:DUF4283 domain-containing protein n=1 Tax=Punica granatum TaxID=22663 RepID=A0A2I0L3E1_PUNGR|nr:hypothetical protein CRG98_004380 [Punica granatum]
MANATALEEGGPLTEEVDLLNRSIKRAKKLWRQKGFIDITDPPNDFYLIKFTSEEDREWALSGGFAWKLMAKVFSLSTKDSTLFASTVGDLATRRRIVVSLNGWEMKSAQGMRIRAGGESLGRKLDKGERSKAQNPELAENGHGDGSRFGILGEKSAENGGKEIPGNMRRDDHGAGSGGFIRTTKEYIREEQPDVMILVDLRINRTKANRVCRKFAEFSCERIEAQGFSGVIYACSRVAPRRDLWQFLEDTSTAVHRPWAVIGDFNEIVDASEKQGGSSIRSKSGGQVSGGS